LPKKLKIYWCDFHSFTCTTFVITNKQIAASSSPVIDKNISKHTIFGDSHMLAANVFLSHNRRRHYERKSKAKTPWRHKKIEFHSLCVCRAIVGNANMTNHRLINIGTLHNKYCVILLLLITRNPELVSVINNNFNTHEHN
jgi:hypothetical protein